MAGEEPAERRNRKTGTVESTGFADEQGAVTLERFH